MYLYDGKNSKYRVLEGINVAKFSSSKPNFVGMILTSENRHQSVLFCNMDENLKVTGFKNLGIHLIRTMEFMKMT